jgi:hypothetical protein
MISRPAATNAGRRAAEASDLARALRMYRRFETTSPAYRAIAARLGYTTGDLNARFSAVLAAEADARGRARYAAKQGAA